MNAASDQEFMAYTLQLALLQSFPGKPGGDPVIRVGPAWGSTWDTDFALHARRGFKVAVSVRKGIPGFVEITSKFGKTCKIRNPWPDGELDLYRNGKKEKTLKV